VIDLIWPHLGRSAGAANLHKAAHYARQALGDRRAIVLAGEQVALWPDATVEVDALRFEEEAQCALRIGDPQTCGAVAETYQGDLLPDDTYVDWASTLRQRLRDLYLQLLRKAGLWAKLAEEEPTDETAQRALMRAYAVAGRRSDALEQFGRLQEALARIDAEPTMETRALYNELAHTALPASPVRYARVGRLDIAYQVVPGGSVDILMIPGWISHLELEWEEPNWLRWCERMTSFARLVRFDKPGTGLSDRPSEMPALADSTKHALAVLDAAGLERAYVMGWSQGGPSAILLAVTHPERVQGLILYGTQACFRRGPDYPWGLSDAELEPSLEYAEAEWGELAFASHFAPTGDERFARWWAAYSRAAATPSIAVAIQRANSVIDIRDRLHEIRVPTLVLCRRGDPIGPPAAGRYMADKISGSRFVELEGDDHVMWVGDSEALCREIEAFVTHTRRPRVRKV
jgi:pimeloyl-ACP methyl ester carboxylesterase